MAQYQGAAIIPLESVCRDYFEGTVHAEGEIGLPVVRIEPSQKAAKGIHINDLARWIDARHAAGVKECDRIAARR
jgi:hypothetical protein